MRSGIQKQDGAQEAGRGSHHEVLDAVERKLEASIAMENVLLGLLVERGVTPSSAEICSAFNRVKHEKAIVSAARELEQYLWKSVGGSDEWPIEIRTASDEGGELARLLQKLRASIQASNA